MYNLHYSNNQLGRYKKIPFSKEVHIYREGSLDNDKAKIVAILDSGNKMLISENQNKCKYIPKEKNNSYPYSFYIKNDNIIFEVNNTDYNVSIGSKNLKQGKFNIEGDCDIYIGGKKGFKLQLRKN